MSIKVYDLSIIGFGARGLHVLEQVYRSISSKTKIDYPITAVVENSNSLGTGLAWNPDQSGANWSNISDRAMEPLQGRPEFDIEGNIIKSYPSFLEWLSREEGVSINEHEDTFSKRKTTGRYLRHRAKSLLKPLQELGLVQLINDRAVGIERDTHSDSYQIELTGNSIKAKTVVMTMGHLPTASSTQNLSFEEHANNHAIFFSARPYSTQALGIYKKSKDFIIKGFGLAMIDVVRMILEHHPGEFKTESGTIFLTYQKIDPIKITPFSLNGLAMVPKPIGEIVDRIFDTRKYGRSRMLDQLKAAIARGQVTSIEDILRPIAHIAVEIYQQLESRFVEMPLEMEDGKELVMQWLKDQTTPSPHILDINMPVQDYMTQLCYMSHGEKPFSLDYTVGQVWRDLQIDLYYLYTNDLLPVDIVEEFIKINEQAKRYSFGPPVQSVLQLIALEKAGVLDLKFVNDPDIELIDKGFLLSKGCHQTVSNTLIDSVLSKPDFNTITDPLIKSLDKKLLAENYSDGLGIHVSSNGSHRKDLQMVKGLYSIGRNAKGSIYGVDAILECFNSERLEPVINAIIENLEDQR